MGAGKIQRSGLASRFLSAQAASRGFFCAIAPPFIMSGWAGRPLKGGPVESPVCQPVQFGAHDWHHAAEYTFTLGA